MHISAIHVDISGGQALPEKYIDIDAYIRYNGVLDPATNQLTGAESVLEFRFKYCNDYGMLIYQDGGSSPGKQGLFFALGVNSRKIYLEWRVTTGVLVEVGLVIIECLETRTVLPACSNGRSGAIIVGLKTLYYKFSSG